MSVGWLAQVLLARQMEQSVKEFAAWRRKREREVAQLRRQGRKQAAQVRALFSPGARSAHTLHALLLYACFLCQPLRNSMGGKGACGVY